MNTKPKTPSNPEAFNVERALVPAAFVLGIVPCACSTSRGFCSMISMTPVSSAV